jgi:hypothetical protein
MSDLKVKETNDYRIGANIYKITNVYGQGKTIKELIKEMIATKSKYVS